MKIVTDAGYHGWVGIEYEGSKLPEPDGIRPPSPDGKASSVQFIRFSFTADQVTRFKSAGARIIAGFDHPQYGHMAVLTEPVCLALAQDFD